MNDTKLKPCPFCGGEAKYLAHTFYKMSSTYGVRCDECGSESRQFFENEEEAAEAWNRRVKDENA